MVKVNFYGPLKNYFGNTAEVKGRTLLEILSSIDANNVLIERKQNKIKSGIIILIDGMDWRINSAINDESQIDIIPVNHGG
ncbi:hypothetical protein HS7_05450 [Sulfolobales archaeon HS-7]|nr:hypothetical protein HS7_05450 [Sulfolobales archaeon HS-7]